MISVIWWIASSQLRLEYAEFPHDVIKVPDLDIIMLLLLAGGRHCFDFVASKRRGEEERTPLSDHGAAGEENDCALFVTTFCRRINI